MPIRSMLGLLACGLVNLFAANVANAQPRAANLQPSAASRQLTPAINQSLGLAHSDMTVVALRRTDTSDTTAQLLLDGRPETLQLHRHSVRAPNYQLLVQQPDGSLKPAPPGPITTVRGTVVGVPGSEVGGSLDQQGLHALVLMPGRPRLWVEPARTVVASADGDAHVVYADTDRQGNGTTCATDGPIASGATGTSAAPIIASAASAGENDTRWAQLAVDTDVEYYALRGSVAAVEAEINEVINISNIEYQRDVGIGHYIVTIIVRPTEPDPFSSFDPSNLLDQFRNHWFQFRGGIERDVAHLFTGKALNGGLGGIAYISGICSDVEGYSLVSRLAQFCGALACRTDLTSHELGHNWAASHCACPGWTMNTQVQSANKFHPTFSIPQIVPYRDTRDCLQLGDTLEGLTVSSPSATIAETNEAPFGAIAQFEFNYDQTVTDQVTWTVDPPTLGTISADGWFTAAEVDGAVDGTINAQYTFDSVTQMASVNITVIDAQPAPLPDPALPDKVRYISISPPAPGTATALRVRIVSLYEPDPPDLQPRLDLVGWEGYEYWVSQPQTCNDFNGLGPFLCAKLSCTPYYSANWGTQVIHLTGAEIIPSSSYEIRAFPASCQGIEDACGLGSAALIVHTQRWGDIAPPFQSPGGTRQPNVLDITAGVDKVRNVPGAPPLPIAQAQPAVPDPTSAPSAVDVAMIVDAVKGQGYPLGGPCLCPPPFNCPIIDDCGRCFH